MSKSKLWDGGGGGGAGKDREASIIGPNTFKILADLGAMALCPPPSGSALDLHLSIYLRGSDLNFGYND